MGEGLQGKSATSDVLISMIHESASSPSQHIPQTHKEDRMDLATDERNLSYPPDIGHCWDTNLWCWGRERDPHHLVDRRLSIHEN